MSPNEASDKVYSDTCKMVGRDNVEKYFAQFRSLGREAMVDQVDLWYDEIGRAIELLCSTESSKSRKHKFKKLDPELREAMMMMCYVQHEKLLLGESSLSIERVEWLEDLLSPD